MSKNPRGRHSAREGYTRPVEPAPSDKPDGRKEPLWRRPLAWLGGIATFVIGGVLVSVLSTQAQRIAPTPTPAQTQTKQANSTVSTTDNQSQSPPKSPPLKILSEDPINLDELGVWTFPAKMILPSNQLAKLNSSFLHSGPGGAADYLFPLGGYAQSVDTQIVVQNVHKHPIQILNMNVIKNCRAPLTGTVFYAPGQVAVEVIQMGFNLDTADTAAKLVNRIPTVSPSAPDYFSKYTVIIQPGATQTFNIRAVTAKYACTFRYDATILDGTRKVHQQIGDGKQPFRISALATRVQQPYFSRYAVVYVGGVQSTGGIGPYLRVNPKTYTG